MTAEAKRTGENVPKYAHGKNPASLANLKAPWAAGESGNALGKQAAGPVVTPALRRFALLPVEKVKEISNHPERLTMAEAIALVTLTDALKTGSFTTGAKSRDQVFDRLDGDAPKVDVTVNVDNRRVTVYHNGLSE